MNDWLPLSMIQCITANWYWT